MTTKFLHVALNCRDPIAIEKFYSKYFGFNRARVYAPGPDQVVIINSGHLSFELFKSSEISPLPAPDKSGYEFSGWRHVCFAVDNLEEKLKEMGSDAKLTLGPLDMGQFIADMNVCWLADPEGNILELNQGYRDEDNPPPITAV